jgi:hypothetical protein
VPAQEAQQSVLVEMGCGGPAAMSGSATFTVTLDGGGGPTEVTLSCDDTNRAVNKTYPIAGAITGWNVALSVSSDSGQNSCNYDGSVIPVRQHCEIQDDNHTIEFSMK